MPDYTDIADLTARSPLGVHLDWRTVTISEDHAVLTMPFRPHNVTVGNVVHGGAIAALADAAATAACWATRARTPESRGTTIALNINYLRAAAGCDLTAVAHVVRRGKSICVADVSVEDGDANQVARVTATYKLDH